MQARERPGLVTYTTAGDPDLPRSAEILKALDRAGADVLEVGVPFSDPLADGPVIQRATERALAAGGSLRAALALVAGGAGRGSAPIVLFTYANPLLRMGLERFAQRAADAGVDGVLALDLPIEEAGEFRERAGGGWDRYDLPPESDDDRRAHSEGGRARARIPLRDLAAGRHRCARDRWRRAPRRLVRRIRAHTTLPIALGFGISRPEHVAEVGAYADAAVVGSALVSLIAEASRSPALVTGVEDYVRVS